MLQQGGQIKDQFGGLRPMFSALLGTISPTMIGVGALAAGTAALMYSYYQGSSTLSEFNKTLTLTGNTAGLTAVRMQTIAAAGEKAGLTFNQTSQALTALVTAGVRAVLTSKSLRSRLRNLRMHPVCRSIRWLKHLGAWPMIRRQGCWRWRSSFTTSRLSRLHMLPLCSALGMKQAHCRRQTKQHRRVQQADCQHPRQHGHD
jgi:hypothetical protein